MPGLISDKTSIFVYHYRMGYARSNLRSNFPSLFIVTEGNIPGLIPGKCPTLFIVTEWYMPGRISDKTLIFVYRYRMGYFR